MTEHRILSSVSNYLAGHGCQVLRLSAKALPVGIKCPDFQVLLNDGTSFYCEVKSPLLQANEITEMFHWTTSVTKLRDLMHKAAEQFSDEDPKHESPWVLIFTSDHMQLNWSNLTHAYTGRVYYGDKTIVDLTHLKRVQETVRDVEQIDLFVWLQMNEKADIYQVRLMIQPKTKLKCQVIEIGRKLEPTPTDISYQR